MAKEELSDRILVKKILEGNSLVFKTIIANTQGLVFQIIYKMIRNPEDQKDLVQEVYLKVYHKLSGFKFNAKLSTWIGTIAYNACINFLEKKRISILDVSDEKEDKSWETVMDNSLMDNNLNPTELYIFNKQRSEILTKEIDKLAPMYKTIITLYHSEELSYKEIAEITNLPVGTLKSYLFRARKILQENLSHNYKKEDL